MNSSTFSRPIPIEYIRNVGIFNNLCDNDLIDFILDYTEPQPPRYTEAQLSFPREVLSYSPVEHPASIKAIYRRSGTTYQINLLPYLSPEKEHLDILADGIILSSSSSNSDQNVIDLLLRHRKQLPRPIPCMIFLDNKDQKSGEQRLQILTDHAKESGCPIMLLQLPIITDTHTKNDIFPGFVRKEQEAGFCGFVDLLTKKAYVIEGLYGDEITEIPIPNDLSDQVKKAHQTILENLADSDPEIEKAYCNDTAVDLQILKQALRKKTVSGETIPVFCGIAAHYQSVTCSFGKSYDWPHKKGIQPFLDAIADYFPSPLDAQAQMLKGFNPFTGAQEMRHCRSDEPFTALVFANTGELKVLSGIAVPGMTIYNSLKKKTAPLGKMYQKTATACDKEEKAVFCGDTAQHRSIEPARRTAILSDAQHPFVLKSTPVAAVAIESPNAELSEEFFADAPTVSRFRNTLNGKNYLVSSDHTELQAIKNRIEKAAVSAPVSKKVKVGSPEAFYRETITISIDFDSRLDGSADTNRDIAIVLKLSPLADGGGVVITNQISGSAVPEKLIKQVQTGIWEAAANGILAGYPMENILIEIIEIECTSAPLPSQLFRDAGYNAMRKAVGLAEPILLEPRSFVQISTKENVLGDVLGFITERNGTISSLTSISPDTTLISFLISAKEIFSNFESMLRNVSRAQAELRHHLPNGFQEISAAEQKEIIKRTLGTLQS